MGEVHNGNDDGIENFALMADLEAICQLASEATGRGTSTTISQTSKEVAFMVQHSIICEKITNAKKPSGTLVPIGDGNPRRRLNLKKWTISW